MTRSRHYVFGYGSLLERWRPDGGGEGPRLAELQRFRRTWNVAMDNMETIPGYKYYVERATGRRRDWFVTFLNVVPDVGANVNGVVFPVSCQELAELDARERNYRRLEVTRQLRPAVDGQAWVYAGSEAAVRRFELGRRTGRAAVCRDYYDQVLDDFATVGADAAETFLALTDPPPCPILELRRVDLSGLGGPRSGSAATG